MRQWIAVLRIYGRATVWSDLLLLVLHCLARVQVSPSFL